MGLCIVCRPSLYVIITSRNIKNMSGYHINALLNYQQNIKLNHDGPFLVENGSQSLSLYDIIC